MSVDGDNWVLSQVSISRQNKDGTSQENVICPCGSTEFNLGPGLEKGYMLHCTRCKKQFSTSLASTDLPIRSIWG